MRMLPVPQPMSAEIHGFNAARFLHQSQMIHAPVRLPLHQEPIQAQRSEQQQILHLLVVQRQMEPAEAYGTLWRVLLLASHLRSPHAREQHLTLKYASFPDLVVPSRALEEATISVELNLRLLGITPLEQLITCWCMVLERLQVHLA